MSRPQLDKLKKFTESGFFQPMIIICCIFAFIFKLIIFFAKLSRQDNITGKTKSSNYQLKQKNNRINGFNIAYFVLIIILLILTIIGLIGNNKYVVSLNFIPIGLGIWDFINTMSFTKTNDTHDSKTYSLDITMIGILFITALITKLFFK